MKTVGGGAAGRVIAVLLGLKRMYRITRNSERRMRLMGVAIEALREIVSQSRADVC